MATLKEKVSNVALTIKERKVLSTLNECLQPYFGEEYSDTDCKDLAEILHEDVKTIKGVVGSLVKKNVLTTYDTGTGFEVISFVGQEDMDYEKF